uniref:Uncharacterized protein n=1 Tax=Wuchereria bancrofti TaxID=6293 RepID=A0AAF5PJC2_WUCBA
MNIRGRTVSSIKIPPKRPEYFTSEREQKLDYIEVDECLIRAWYVTLSTNVYKKNHLRRYGISIIGSYKEKK